jgi:hypothetical protein
MIRCIDTLVASPKVSTKRKRIVLNEFTGQIVGRHSITLTHRRCQIADDYMREDREWYIGLLFGSIRECSWNAGAKGERVLLHQAVKRARKNGWDDGEAILDTLTDGRPFDEGYVLRGLLTLDDFLAAFW